MVAVALEKLLSCLSLKSQWKFSGEEREERRLVGLSCFLYAASVVQCSKSAAAHLSKVVNYTCRAEKWKCTSSLLAKYSSLNCQLCQPKRRAKINLYKCRKCNKNNVPHARRIAHQNTSRRHLHIPAIVFAKHLKNVSFLIQEVCAQLFFHLCSLESHWKSFMSLKSAHQHRNVNSLA